MGSKPACTREGSGYLLLGHPYSRPCLCRRLQWGWWRRLRCCKLVLRDRSPRCSLCRRSCYLPGGRNLDHRILVFWTSDACELLQISRQTSWLLRATGPLHVPYTLRIPCKHPSYAPEPVTLSCTCTLVQVTSLNLDYLTLSLSPVSFYFSHAHNMNP